MDEENNIEEYFSKLPVAVQDCVTSAEWKERFNKIVAKYALNKEQASNLHLEILLTLVGVEGEESLTENIKTEVGVSGLLAEQLVLEVQDRMFSWIDKVYEAKNPKQKIPQTIIEKTVVDAQNDIPEIRPRITPMIELGEKVHTIKPFSVTNNLVTTQSQTQTGEVVQGPVSVPRYTGETTPTPEGIGGPTENVGSKPPEPIAPLVKRYAVDPYREPLE